MTLIDSRTDAHGNPVSNGYGVDRYDLALDRYLRYHPDVIDVATALVTEEPQFPMGHAMAAYLSLSSTDTVDLPGARESAEALAALELNRREAAHLAAIQKWMAGDWHGAARQLDQLLIAWPSDLLALLSGHLLDFFTGDARNLRDRVARSIGSIDPESPHYGFVRGMFAFGLEESGHYEAAEAHGLAAVEAHPDDVWATHAVVHVYEMQGRVADGIRFLRSREGDWGDGNLFMVHNWWHLALYLLEAGKVDEALAIYDARVHNRESAGVPLEMLDASALLWRLYLEGEDTGARFSELADAWVSRTVDEPWYVFNDMHAVMALVGAGRMTEARAVVDRLERYAAARGAASATNLAMTVQVGLPASRALVAFADGNDRRVIDELLPIRATFQVFGGSHAQRDALQRTLLTSAIRARELDLATALVNERLATRESSVYTLSRFAEIANARADLVNAQRYAKAAATYRSQFAAAI
jgi:tetratricopeptide (TPR) repeat protein